jgi:hypothetical protein
MMAEPESDREFPIADLKAWERPLARWVRGHPAAAERMDHAVEAFGQKMDHNFEKVDRYLEKYPGAEFPYWGTICMLIAATGPCYLLFLLALIPGLVFGGTWMWFAGCLLGAGLFFTCAAVVVWSEDRATLRKRGWFDGGV